MPRPRSLHKGMQSFRSSNPHDDLASNETDHISSTVENWVSYRHSKLLYLYWRTKLSTVLVPDGFIVLFHRHGGKRFLYMWPKKRAQKDLISFLTLQEGFLKWPSHWREWEIASEICTGPVLLQIKKPSPVYELINQNDQISWLNPSIDRVQSRNDSLPC